MEEKQPEKSKREQVAEEVAGCDTAEKLINLLNSMSDKGATYVVIRDMVTQQQLKMVQADVNQYKKFQAIKLAAKQRWDWLHKMASMEDVEEACLKYYTVTLKMIKAIQDDELDQDSILNRMGSAINKIEERLDLPQTIWRPVPSKITVTEDTDHVHVDGGQEVNQPPQ